MPRAKKSSLTVFADRAPGARLVRLGSSYALPERFTADVEPAEADLPISHLTLVVEGGRTVVCEQLHLQRRPDGPPLGGSLMRRLPLADYIRRAADELMFEIWPTDDPSAPVAVYAEGERHQLRSEPLDESHVAVRVGGLTLTPDYADTTGAPRGALQPGELQAVADLYRAALAEGAPPTKAVQTRFYVSRSTASRWIRRARDEGLLGRARPRVAGEVDSPDSEAK